MYCIIWVSLNEKSQYLDSEELAYGWLDLAKPWN